MTEEQRKKAKPKGEPLVSNNDFNCNTQSSHWNNRLECKVAGGLFKVRTHRRLIKNILTLKSVLGKLPSTLRKCHINFL